MESETMPAGESSDRAYRSKRTGNPNPAPDRVYYSKRHYGERTGDVAGTDAGARAAAGAASISAEEIRANHTTTSGDIISSTTASGGAAIAPSTDITRR